MASNVSTKLLDKKGDADFATRKRAIVTAWRTWLHEIIAAMDAQRRREDLTDDAIITEEMGALMAEYDHCQEVGAALMGEPTDNASEAERP